MMPAELDEEKFRFNCLTSNPLHFPFNHCGPLLDLCFYVSVETLLGEILTALAQFIMKSSI